MSVCYSIYKGKKIGIGIDGEFKKSPKGFLIGTFVVPVSESAEDFSEELGRDIFNGFVNEHECWIFDEKYEKCSIIPLNYPVTKIEVHFINWKYNL